MTANFAPYIDTEIGRVSVPPEEFFSFAGAAGLVTGIVVYPYTYACVVNGGPTADHYSNTDALPGETRRRVAVIQDTERARRIRPLGDPRPTETSAPVNQYLDAEKPIGRTETGEPVYAHKPPMVMTEPVRLPPVGTYLTLAFETPEALERMALQIIRDIQISIDFAVDEALIRDANTAAVRTRLAYVAEDETRLTGWGEIARVAITDTLNGGPSNG